MAQKATFRTKEREESVMDQLNIQFDSSITNKEEREKAREKLKETLAYIDNYPESSKLLNDFLKKGEPIVLTKKFDSAYAEFRQGNALVFNPYRAYYNYDKKGGDRKINGVVSVASILVHELFHATDPDLEYNKDTLDSDGDFGDNKLDNFAEELARNAANKFRAFYGEPTRVDLETLGRSIEVDDPTFAIKDNPTFNQFANSINQYYDELEEKYKKDISKIVEDFIHQNWDNLFRNPLIMQYDPLTLDLDGDGIETLASNGHKGALFDHSNDGIRTATGWINNDDGLLVYDRNGDGVVNNGGELFGDNTLLKNSERAANGYQALAELDENSDGKVDAADSAFAKLRVWRDLNQDGISQEGELLTLNEAKVKALNLANKNADRDLGNGNSLAEEGTYTDSDGNEKQMGDLNLAADHFHSRYADSLPLTDEQQQAPNLRGSGRVRDLREAAA